MKNTINLSETMPKVGIRPVIDARLDGIRESLEDQTMDMARRAADFLEKNLRNLYCPLEKLLFLSSFLGYIIDPIFQVNLLV